MTYANARPVGKSPWGQALPGIIVQLIWFLPIKYRELTKKSLYILIGPINWYDLSTSYVRIRDWDVPDLDLAETS
jgi:hypothetical protein